MLLAAARIEYAPAMAAIHAACFETPWSESELCALLALPTTVARIDEFGFLLCSRVADEMEILTIGVLPEHRRHHVGSSLLSEMIDWAGSVGVKRIFLEVSVENLPARRLYERFGFCQTGVRRGYYRTSSGQADALCLTKKISD